VGHARVGEGDEQQQNHRSGYVAGTMVLPRSAPTFDLMEALAEYIDKMTSGPGTFRFLIQPLLAILLGIRDGRLDSHAGHPPIFRAGRGELGAALRRIVVPLCLAAGMSLLYQYLIMRQVRLWPALLLAVFIVALPYLLARALAQRADVRWHKTHPRHG
jgi:hypothetical protein